MYVISGVTGNTGAGAARELIERGHKPRVVVRDSAKGAPWQELGADVAVADLSDTESLAAALKSVDGAYLLNPPPSPQVNDVLANAAHINDMEIRRGQVSLDEALRGLTA